MTPKGAPPTAAIKTTFETSSPSDDHDESEDDSNMLPLLLRDRLWQMTAILLMLVFGVAAVQGTNKELASNVGSDVGVLDSTASSSLSFLEYTTEGKVTWANRTMPPSGSLLDPLVDAWRRGERVDTTILGITAPNPKALQNCSCLTIKPDVFQLHGKTLDPCCARVYIRGHKMGVQLVSLLFRSFDFHNRYQPLDAEHWIDANDLRVVLILRNIYEAIVSGYLYHKQGRECYTDPNGLPLRDKKTHQRKVGHTNYVDFTTFMDTRNDHVADNLCQYIMDEPVERGMRAYIDFVFRGDYYSSSLLAWRALSQHVDWIQERTHVTCYEDLMANRTAALDDLVAFYYPSAVPHSVQVRARDADRLQMLSSKHGTYSGPHSTNHDAELRTSLMQVVQRLDDEDYQGQIAFVDSMIPCGK